MIRPISAVPPLTFFHQTPKSAGTPDLRTHGVHCSVFCVWTLY